MAAAYAVILSSSPARGLIATTPPSTAQHAIPSSPGLPSLSEILAEKMPRPPNQNKTIAVPDTTTDFTSARSLPRKEDVTQPLNAQRQLGLAGYNHGLDVGGTKADAEKSRTERNKSEHAKVLRTSKSSSTPKLSGDTVGAENEVNHENMIDSGRKKRMKKPKKDDQTKIMKAKVTKPRSSSNSSKHPKKVCTGSIRAIVDNQCDIEAAIDGEENKSGAYNEPDLGLIEALRRRRDWTPARDTLRDSGRVNQLEAAGSALTSVESPSIVKSADAGLFQRLGEYGFGGADPAVVSRPHQLRELNGQAATKKRKLDLVAGLASAVSKAIVTKRSKSPKKKPQTITDKATAPFAHDQAGASTILNYFANPQPSTNPSTIVLSQQEVSNECNEKHDRSGQAKSSKPKVKKKKKSKEPPIVHPPELAVRVANEQDLLFGTCSQLARDESPSFIRDLQRAVKKSEAVEDSQLLSQGQESQLSAKSSSSSPSITRLPSAARSLWSVAARNEKGSLLDVDVVDLVDSPQARRSFSAKPDLGSVEEKKSIPPASAVAVAVDSDWRTIDTLVINQGLDQHEAEHSLPRSVAEASVRARPKSRPPVKKSTHRIDQELSTTEGEPYPEMPNYKGFTDVDLKRAVSKTGFKAIRKREDMISHLERCWQAARSRMRPLDTSARPTSANIGLNEATKSSSAAKKRGRPPKNISALTDEDGAAVTSTVSPKKPRGRPKKGASRSSTSSKLQAKDYSATNSLQQSSETQLVDIAEADHIFSGPASPPAPHKITAPSTRTNMTLLATITNAVTSCPPTHDVQNLTPYEKMLLYDPIVLEDFAQWLNDEGLKRVGCNETVVPTVAKLWCESQSVCCLWRENLKGGTRARY